MNSTNTNPNPNTQTQENTVNNPEPTPNQYALARTDDAGDNYIDDYIVRGWQIAHAEHHTSHSGRDLYLYETVDGEIVRHVVYTRMADVPDPSYVEVFATAAEAIAYLREQADRMGWLDIRAWHQALITSDDLLAAAGDQLDDVLALLDDRRAALKAEADAWNAKMAAKDAQ